MRTRRCGIPALLLHGSLLLASLATVCASTGLIVYLFAYKDQAAERLFGAHPVYAAGPLNADPLADYGPVFTVGHNAGASLTTTRQAIANGADVVEIDIVAMRGKLVSAHQPPAWVGPVTFQGPTLEQVWRAARNAEVIQLDLKESTPAFRKLLFAFLDKHAGEHTVLVATADVAMLDDIRDRHPEVLRFLSVANHGRLERLLADADLAESLDGVTIRYQLVSAESVRRLKAMGLTVLAWTVNDLATVNEFVSWGVDGISTNNLAIMELLSGQGSGAGALSRETADAGGEPGADL